MPLKDAFREIGEALLGEVRRHYGDRLVSLVVYGSVGRGTMRPDSDIDILIVAADLPAGRIPRVNDFAAEATYIVQRATMLMVRNNNTSPAQ